jgi:hypothetical protein
MRVASAAVALCQQSALASLSMQQARRYFLGLLGLCPQGQDQTRYLQVTAVGG